MQIKDVCAFMRPFKTLLGFILPTLFLITLTFKSAYAQQTDVDQFVRGMRIFAVIAKSIPFQMGEGTQVIFQNGQPLIDENWKNYKLNELECLISMKERDPRYQLEPGKLLSLSLNEDTGVMGSGISFLDPNRTFVGYSNQISDTLKTFPVSRSIRQLNAKNVILDQTTGKNVLSSDSEIDWISCAQNGKAIISVDDLQTTFGEYILFSDKANAFLEQNSKKSSPSPVTATAKPELR